MSEALHHSGGEQPSFHIYSPACTLPRRLRWRLIFLFISLGLVAKVWAQSPWDLEKLSQTPQVYPASSPQQPGMQALFFEGPAWQGKPTRIFAWYGQPARKGNDKLLAIQAVAGIMLANSLLRSFPDVDPERIGITGISWGGYLTAIASSVDTRFRFSIPVYGYGFRADYPDWPATAAQMGPANAQRWLGLWDPSVYLHRARMPFLWVDGSNDFFCPLNQLQKSYALAHGPNFLSIRVRMTHSQQAGQSSPEIVAFANQIVQAGVPLVVIQSQGERANNAWVKYHSAGHVTRGELVHTFDTGPWQPRAWSTAPAGVMEKTHTVEAMIPARTIAYYFNLIDDRGLMVSTPHRTV